ncbi:MAG: isopenicillin N synthase family oxygenase, partial [Proteobacteria bacterium]|nr:isopenicillin N synthase family oxygenase [Pseudomonadota bacterium]
MLLNALPALSMRNRERDPDGFARAMGESYANFGFAIVRDHGLDVDATARALAATKAFFSLPDVVKRKYRLEGQAGQRGYIPFGVEAAKNAKAVDLKEFWHVGRELPAGHRYRSYMPENVWPAEIASFRDDIYGLYQALDEMGAELLRSIAMFLELPADFFVNATRDGNSVLRLLHYPPTPPAPAGVRAAAHEDINVITLLLGAEEAGLQLQTRDGRWIDVNPPEGALVV